MEEPIEKLSKQTLDLQRARQSIIEELAAINFYQQRIDATTDSELKKILVHNMDEEKEHVAMLMEYVMKIDKTQAKAFKEHD
jgi:hypothetical protein